MRSYIYNPVHQCEADVAGVLVVRRRHATRLLEHAGPHSHRYCKKACLMSSLVTPGAGFSICSNLFLTSQPIMDSVKSK